MPIGSFDDDSEPLTLKSHAPLQVENVDMRINILKEYLLKSPDATVKDLKKSLVGSSKYTEDEFKELIKSANLEKYNELYPVTTTQTKPKSTRGGYVERITQSEINCLERNRNKSRQEAYADYRKEFPESTRKLQFVYDYYHANKTSAPVYVYKRPEEKNPVKHVVVSKTTMPDTPHILAHAINSLYKSGKSPKIFPQIKPVLELIKDPNAVDFAIECLTS